MSSPSSPPTESRIAGARVRATKKPAAAPAGPARAVLVNTFFWKILVTRVNRNFRPPFNGRSPYPRPPAIWIGEKRRTSMAGQILYLITRYGRPRVYHPASGGYVSSEGLAGDIDDLPQMQREGGAIVVLDTGTGADGTPV